MVKINLSCPDNRLKLIWIIDVWRMLSILYLKQMKMECLWHLGSLKSVRDTGTLLVQDLKYWVNRERCKITQYYSIWFRCMDCLLPHGGLWRILYWESASPCFQIHFCINSVCPWANHLISQFPNLLNYNMGLPITQGRWSNCGDKTLEQQRYKQP